MNMNIVHTGKLTGNLPVLSSTKTKRTKLI